MHRIVLVVLVLLVGCARAEPGTDVAESPETTASPAAEPSELPDARCEDTNAGNAANFPRFLDVKVESDGDRDRVTFEFDPEAGAPDEPPFHVVTFTDQLITDGEGREVQAEGETFLVVSFQAVGVDFSQGDKPVEVYTGPKRFTPRYGVLKEIVHLGDFEGQVTWGLGLGREACYVLEAEQDHLTLEFPSA